jgi:hypothetical protein
MKVNIIVKTATTQDNGGAFFQIAVSPSEIILRNSGETCTQTTAFRLKG